jgi:pyruvate/2-oxoglutarate dehydrogenase complex dihydrolipoamide acyltransferase (E2) component
MTSTESIFHTMRILKAPPIPTQKIEAPTIEQLNAANPERRAIALGALIVGPIGLLFTLICFIAMPPAPPSAAEVARANHILTVADGPAEAVAVNGDDNKRRRSEWLPDEDSSVSPADATRYSLPSGAAGVKGRGQAGQVDENGDPYGGIEIWPAGAGTHVRPETKDKPINLFENKDAKKDEKAKRVTAEAPRREAARQQDTRTVQAKPVETSPKVESKSSEPKVMVKGVERSGNGGNARNKEIHTVAEPPPAKKSTPTPASSPAAPAKPSKLDADEDLKKPSLD